MSIGSLPNLFKSHLKRVDDLILGESLSQIDLIKDIYHHIFQPTGKKVRPLLTIAGFHFLHDRMVPIEDGNTEKLLFLAAAVECIHTATLLHDDVIDESELRRGVEAAHQVWGNKAAILVGDHLFSKSFRLMVKPHRMDVLSVLATASSIITEGEISQLTHKGDLTLSLDMYMDVVRAKTATLFGAAAKVGAMSANGTEKICHTLHDMAFNFGMAFQIRDDLMDYGLMGAHRTKNIGDDFYEGKVTLPLLFHYAASSATEQTFLKELINNQNRTNAEFLKIQQAMKEKHIMDHCKEMLHFYLEKAHFGLNAFSGHWLFLPFKDYMAQLFTGL